jgi:DNA-binding Lrp family transcriptional regulator
MDSIKEANVVNGAYGIVAKVKAHTMDKLREVIASKVRRLSGVRSTLTMMVVEGSQDSSFRINRSFQSQA